MVLLASYRALVVEAQPRTVLFNRNREFGAASLKVDVVDPQNKSPAVDFGQIVVEQRGVGVTEMQETVGTGGEAEDGPGQLLLLHMTGRCTSTVVPKMTGRNSAMRSIETEADIDEGLAHIAAVDPRLSTVIAISGRVPVRRRPAGFAGLMNIIVSQQLSAASANAIWRRVALAMPDPTPDLVTDATDDDLRSMGLSMLKIRAVRAAASACRGGLDLSALAQMPPEDASAALTAISGVGPWTADIYLLFCLGHADVFPVGDLALRIAVAEAIGSRTAPTYSELAGISELWSPWRGVAAGLFWAYYRTLGVEQRARISMNTKKRAARR